MKPVRTPGVTAVLHGGRDAYGDLPFERCQADCTMTLWDLSPEERIAIAEGAMVELHMQYHNPPPPISLMVSARSREI